jgi:hypothetical protein
LLAWREKVPGTFFHGAKRGQDPFSQKRGQDPFSLKASPERKKGPDPFSFAWLLGRGVAEALGLRWTVPESHYDAFRRGWITRGELVEGIRDALEVAQALARFDAARARRFAALLPPGCEHRLVTTNWNTLLDRALAPLGLRVWHLNGSLDDPAEGVLTELDLRDESDSCAAGLLPGARVLRTPFERWVDEGLPGLR